MDTKVSMHFQWEICTCLPKASCYVLYEHKAEPFPTIHKKAPRRCDAMREVFLLFFSRRLTILCKNRADGCCICTCVFYEGICVNLRVRRPKYVSLIFLYFKYILIFLLLNYIERVSHSVFCIRNRKWDDILTAGLFLSALTGKWNLLGMHRCMHACSPEPLLFSAYTFLLFCLYLCFYWWTIMYDVILCTLPAPKMMLIIHIKIVQTHA